MNLGLTGKVIVVTGGASGIGKACAHAALQEGARVAVLDANVELGQALIGQFGDMNFMVVPTDVTDERSVSAAIGAVVDRFKAIDSLIACAGISGPVGKRVIDIEQSEWDRVMAVNIRGVFLSAKHALPYLEARGGSTIVLVASDSSLFATAGMTPYCTSKAAALMLAKGLSVDHPSVRVNSVCPSVVDTPMSRRDLGVEARGFDGTGIPAMAPEDVARHVLFLASPVSSPANGTAAVLDFGYAVRSGFPEIAFD
ncbi:SDR family NAD(P)-dependent oxidoreductase [Trinickia dinghuensis]|uniref:SDR family NAD(P)-dependent oxidoreductase n=1 Tax=Trinickia dinghuensis TaxID=2291023 RepID=A0A3D8K165_9BURK|nr:SDR family oxidoreductase [Trinickia dinghuensis]RDU98812.1 SDR family NAD(P)-dependent oxidoreductase [Trinickia dinghuensis]